MKESDLYEPLRAYLEGQGYAVHGEVRGVDVVARHRERPDEIVAIELKSRMSLDLVVQAAQRTELTDSVYVAIPVSGARGTVRNSRGVRTLLQRLGVGLILVRFLRGVIRVETILHPGSPVRPVNARRRTAIIREIDRRYAEFDKGGSPTRLTRAPSAAGRRAGRRAGPFGDGSPGPVRRMTAYRQRAFLTAELLRQAGGTAHPRDLRAAGAPETCGTILARNVYGWFERVERGTYRLHPAGAEALRRDAEAVEVILLSSRRQSPS